MRAPLLALLGVFAFMACGKSGFGGVCGNGKKEGNEDCDYGPNNDGGARCRTDCTFKRCGDGIVDLGKAIDTDNDGLGDIPEACDKGIESDPPCRGDCQGFASCGNGVVDPPMETCDTGPRRSDTAPGACRLDCTKARCGDGVVDPDEECDDQNQINGDGCDNNCTRPRCGNGEVSAGEECDDGNTIEVDVCLPDCARNACTLGLDAQQQACFGVHARGLRLSATLENRPNGVAVGDFDADGKNDVAITTALSSNVDLFFGTGGGELDELDSWNIAAFPVGIIAANLDGAGRVDLGVLSTAAGGSTTTGVLNLNRRGLLDRVDFRRVTQVDPVSGAGQLGVAHLQPDGGAALVFSGAAQLGVARVVEDSRGNQSLQLFMRGVFTTPRLLAGCDLDGDGRREVIFSNLAGALELVADQPFFTNGPLTTSVIEGPTLGLEGLVCADVDGDRRDEVFMLITPPLVRGTIRVFFNSDPNTSSPFFERRQDLELGFRPSMLAAGPGYGVAYADGQRIAARRWINGAFTTEKPRRVFESPMAIRAISLGPLDFDSVSDVAFVAWGADEVVGVLGSSR